MKMNNKIALVTIGSILLIANAIPIGRYLDEKQKVNSTFKSSITSKELNESNISKMKVVRQQVLGKSSISSTSFAKIGPSTNLNIKIIGSGKRWGISRLSYFLKYQTWEKKLIIQSNGTAMTMWNAVDHEVAVGGDDSQNIKVAAQKIADTEVRIKSSGKGWAKMVANKDLKWPKGLDPTVVNTTYSIESSGGTFNPSVSFYYHIKGYDNLKVASYDVFSFSTWLKDHLFAVIMGIVAFCVIVLTIIIMIVSLGSTTAVATVVDPIILSDIIEAEASALISAGIVEDEAEANALITQITNATVELNA